MADPVVHWEVMGKDGPALRSFYGDLFGWQWEIMGGEGAEYGVAPPPEGGPGIGGGVGSSPQGDGHVTFYVQVSDLQAALDKAESLGGRTVMPPMKVGEYVEIGLFADPEGHVVGVVKGE